VSDTLSVGVAIATFNGSRFLDAQLRSIFDQTRLPEEIVISDDGSTDDTLSIARSYRAEAKRAGVRLRVVSHKGRSGVAANFAHAVSLSTTDVVALSDQDDVWLPHKLETLTRVVAADPTVLMVHSDAELVDEAGKPLGMTVLESLRMTSSEKHNLVTGHGIKALVRRNLVTGSTAMIRRDLVARAGPIPAGWLHDEWWALVAASSDGLVLNPQVLGLYRQHDDNQVGATRSGWQRLMERFAEPQREFRERHVERHRGLRDYLDSPNWSGTAEARALLEGRFHHFQWQAGLSSARLARIPSVLGRLVRGDYARYRRGLFDALRDVMQPAE
jgi:glycosyltransferase involved in cell wall biosynthesis